jgi:hypothetical protein
VQSIGACDFDITGRRRIDMKNFSKIGVILAAALVIVSVASVFAQTDTPVLERTRQGVVDANGDGICDITGRVIGSGNGTGQGKQARNGQSQVSGENGGYGANTGKQAGAQRRSGIAGTNCTGIGRTAAGGRMNRSGRR